jgi:hypothetical protein
MSTPIFDCQYPSSMRAREEEFVRTRRRAAGQPANARPVGVALSGGGIRSATFCIGFFQGLVRAGLLRRVDYLSTVSGGGYFGAFLGAMFAREPRTPIADIERAFVDSSSPPVAWLRDNGRYLAPNGAGDRALAGAIILRNWTAVAVVMGTFALALLLAAHTIRVAVRTAVQQTAALDGIARLVWQFGQWHGIYWSPYLLLPVAALLAVTAPLAWAYWLGRPTKLVNRWVWVTTILAAVVAFLQPTIALMVGAVPYEVVPKVIGTIAVLTLITAVVLTILSNGTTSGLGLERIYRNLAARGLTAALMVTAGLLILGIIDTLGQSLYVFAQGGVPTKTIGTAGAGLGLFIGAVQKLSRLLDSSNERSRIRLPFGVLAGLAAVLIVGMLAATLSAIGHGISRGWQPLTTPGTSQNIELSLSDQQYVTVRQVTGPGAAALPPSRWDALLGAVVFGIFAWLLGRTLPFVNQSSLSSFYSARLSRAYTGASNPKRRGASLTTEVEGDDLPLAAYRPHEGGGPLHLINVTLGETVGGQSQIEYRDRKGLAMAVGPAGISVGVRHHAMWKNEKGPDSELVPQAVVARQWSSGHPSPASDVDSFQIWSTSQMIAPEKLGVATWCAISGAAISPGLGARTSLGMSLLLGIGNVRLGHWWDSDTHKANQRGARPKPTVWLRRLFARWFPVQSALTQELLAQFDGPHQRYWYLTDGGHFENTACYELIRRRIPIIIVCDDGADPQYGFEDLAGLVRTARTDFAAHVELLSLNDLAVASSILGDPARYAIGSLSHLRPKVVPRRIDQTATPPAEPAIDLGVRLSRAHAVVARVSYRDDPESDCSPPRPRDQSIVLFVKPTLTGDEPLDVLQYAEAHPDFPQQPTADQFFDEAQWESYRRLGEHIGEKVLCGLELDELFTALTT